MSKLPEPPKTFKEMVRRYPGVTDAHQQMAAAVEAVGPLDEKTRALVKIGICVGAGLESALRAHVRRALAAGASEQEVEQSILLGMTTIGFPSTVAAWSNAQVQFERNRAAAAQTGGEAEDQG